MSRSWEGLLDGVGAESAATRCEAASPVMAETLPKPEAQRSTAASGFADDLSAEVHRALDDVARALSPDDPPDRPSRLEASEFALFFAYLDAYLPNCGYAESALRWLTQALSDGGAEDLYGVALHGGLTQLAWVTAHLGNRIFDADDADPNEAFDARIAELVETSPWAGTYDLMGGLGGLGIYLLERRSRPEARKALGAVVQRLEELASDLEGGVAWLTPPEHLPDWQRGLAPRGYYNLGMAHGSPGVLVVLGGAAALGVETTTATRLLEGGVDWLLRQKLTHPEPSVFPSWICHDAEPRPARLGWCYGDAGIAAGLLCVADDVGRDDWRREALALARHVAGRTPHERIVSELGLCHGASGLATLFARIHLLTYEPTFHDAAAAWTRYALSLRRPDRSVGGVWSFDHLGENTRANPGFLEGAAGFGLALLSLVSDVPPEWHRLLGIALPTREPEAPAP